MIFYIRNKENKTIIEIVLFKKKEDGREFVEISSGINIPEYSELLLNNLNMKDYIIEDFRFLDEIRGWMWEVYFMDGNNNNIDDYDNVKKAISKYINDIANKYNLIVVVD